MEIKVSFGSVLLFLLLLSPSVSMLFLLFDGSLETVVGLSWCMAFFHKRTYSDTSGGGEAMERV